MNTNRIKLGRWILVMIGAAIIVALPPGVAAQTNGPGGAVLIDSAGIGNYVGINTTGTLAGTFTLELWANSDRATNSSVLVGSGNHAFNFRLQQGTQIHGEIGNGTSWITTNADAAFPYSTNVWYHLAYVVTPTSYTIYANGVQVGAGSYVADNPVLYDDTTHSLYIGWSGLSLNQHGDYMNGEIDEVRMWSTARNASEIQTNMHRNLSGSELGLMGYWRFDDCCCPTTADGTGHGFDGNLSGTATQVTSTAPIGTPAIITLPATSVSSFGATLNGTATPNFEDSVAWFEYGLTTNYGNSTATTAISAMNAVTVALSNLVSGLSQNTLYHYRLVATNAVGISYGADSSFTTPIFIPPIFTDIAAGLPAVAYSAVAWGDLDNAGRLDIVLTGVSNVPISQVWRNLGGGNFTNINASVPGVDQGAVALGDFNNSGRLDILLNGVQQNGGFGTAIWRNLDGGVFTNNYSFTSPFPVPVINGALAAGDLDNDGHLDFVLSGFGIPGEIGVPVFQIFLNLGNGTLTNTYPAPIPGVVFGSIALADFDGDGWLDILLTGSTQACYKTNPYGCGGALATNAITQIWRNLGNGTFSNVNVALPGVVYSSVAVGDFDNDGKPDILLTGQGTNQNFISQVWRNLGNWTFTNLNVPLPGVVYGSVAVGDYDNDGKLDILLSGEGGGSTNICQVWRNLGNGTFTNVDGGLPGVVLGSVAWGDSDLDGTLNLLVTGYTNTGFPISEVWRNLTPLTNTVPSAPSGLTAAVTDNGVLLSWSAASDAQTPAAGLSYNLRVGNTPGGFDVVSPEADASTGFRLLPQMGNAQERLFAIVTNLTAGTKYYWSVQAVDTSFAGGPFAPEASFTIAAPLLRIRLADPVDVVISWPLWAKDFVLQSTTNLLSASSWVVVTNVPTATATEFTVTNRPTAGGAFYRLKFN